MWFWKIFVIIFSLASIWLDRGDGAPYSYFGVRVIADNSDVQQPLLKSNSLKTPDRQVSEAKTPNSIPTRGLFYPDDMFFTRWVPNVIGTENCSTDQPSVTTPSYSISTGTLQTKYNDKSTKHQTIVGQQKSTSDAQTSSLAGPRSPRRRKPSTIAVASSRLHQKTTTVDRQSIANRPHDPDFSTASSTSRKLKSSFGVHSSSRSYRKSTRTSKATTDDYTSSRRHQKTSTVDGKSIANHPHITDFVSASSISRKLKSSSFVCSSSSYQKSTRTSEATTDDYTPDLDYFYSTAPSRKEERP